jgi:hypothetical protein
MTTTYPFRCIVFVDQLSRFDLAAQLGKKNQRGVLYNIEGPNIGTVDSSKIMHGATLPQHEGSPPGGKVAR